MESQDIKDSYGRRVGSIVNLGSELEARDSYGRRLGSYKKSDNATRDSYGRILSIGNVLSSLVWGNR